MPAILLREPAWNAKKPPRLAMWGLGFLEDTISVGSPRSIVHGERWRCSGTFQVQRLGLENRSDTACRTACNPATADRCARVGRRVSRIGFWENRRVWVFWRILFSGRFKQGIGKQSLGRAGFGLSERYYSGNRIAAYATAFSVTYLDFSNSLRTYS